MKIRIGTRKSKLAMWQAEFIAGELEKHNLETEIVKIDTTGDKILDVTISKIGSKGVFTEEIEEQLREGKIDIAVHSAKDMPSHLPSGFELIAFTERELPNDVLVSNNKGLDLSSDKKIRIGTSSTRRIALVKKHFPNADTVPVRGNLQRRISKMEEGNCDVLLLAYAGVHRMGYDDKIVEKLPLDSFVPPVGQGSVCIEVHENTDSEKAKAIREICNHTRTETCLLAERAFLKTLNGGCSVPVFAHATLEKDEMTFHGGVISLDGKEIVEFTQKSKKENGIALGLEIADKVIAAGGRRILEEIKSAQD